MQDCFDANRKWAARMRGQDPEFFTRLKDQQKPEILWIGCSDSRLPPESIIGKQPGELFVHRNVANVVSHTDINCLSVLQYGIEVLKVRHVVVCGHYGCGGVSAALKARPLGLIDNWLRHIQDVILTYRDEIEKIPDPEKRADRLCELNVVAQVGNVCRTGIVQGAWEKGQALSVHGWMYSVSDGLLKDLDITVDNMDQIPGKHRLP